MRHAKDIFELRIFHQVLSLQGECLPQFLMRHLGLLKEEVAQAAITSEEFVFKGR
jgi:hypothetical protein